MSGDSSREVDPEPQIGHRTRPSAVPGVADLGQFRGRTERSGVPILPPGWRPDRAEDAPARAEATVVPVPRPAPAPPGGGLVVGSTGREVRPAAATGAPEPGGPGDAGPTTRVLRRVRPWSVWKMTLAFQVCMVAVVAVAGSIIWAVAAALGVLDNLEGFVEDLGFESFTFDGAGMLRALVVGGLLVALASALLASVLATMFNLLSDLTGGIEAETAPAARRRGRRARRRAAPDPLVVDPPPAAPPRPAPTGSAIPAPTAAVEVAGVAQQPHIDLTEDPDVVGDEDEVDHIQLAIDDLLRDESPPGASA